MSESEAVAQTSHDAASEPTTDAAAPSTRTVEASDFAEMVKAAKEAKAKHVAVVPETPANDNEPEAAAQNDNAEPVSEVKPSLAEKLAERTERSRYKREMAELSKQREAIAKQQQEAQQALAEMQRIKAALARAELEPTEAMRALGLDPQKAMEATAAEAQADPVLRRMIQEERQSFRSELQTRDKRIEQLEAYVQQFAGQVYGAHQQQNERKFVETARSEKYPSVWPAIEAVAELQGSDPQKMLVQNAYALIEQVKVKTGGKKIPTDEEILEYLEAQAKGTLAKLRGEGREATQGKAPQGNRAKGPRTLSAVGASERRASPKPLDEMSPEDQRLATMQVVREALKRHAR